MFHFVTILSFMSITLLVKSGSIIIQFLNYSSRNDEKRHLYNGRLFRNDEERHLYNGRLLRIELINVSRPTYGVVLAFPPAKPFLKLFHNIYPISISQLLVMYRDS